MTTAAAVLATTVGLAVAGAHASGVSAGTMSDIVLSTSTVAPGDRFAALFNCEEGAAISYTFLGATSSTTCQEGGLARVVLNAPDQIGGFEVTANTSGQALSATLDVVAPGQPIMFDSGDNDPDLPLAFQISGCAEGSSPVGLFNGQQLTEQCEIAGEDGQTAAVFAYLGPGAPGIYPVTATLDDPSVVLFGAVFVGADGAASPEPELPVSGPADSIVMQLVAAAAAVGLGASLIAWTRRRSTMPPH